MNVLRPYPNEIFYSWVIRMYRLHTKPTKRFLTEMFGITKIGMYKVRNFKEESLQRLLPIEEITKYQSIVPLLQICMTREEYQNMIYDIDKETFTRYKQSLCAKICPKCYQEDIEKYGEPYLHVEHQLPENLVCYQHKIDLVKMKEKTISGLAVELFTLNHKEMKGTYICEHPFYYEVSEMIEKIIKERILGDIYLEDVQEKYKSKLREKGYYMHRLLDRQSLANDLIQEFGHSVLDTVGAGLKQDAGWTKGIVQKQQLKLKLICHLVIIKFLFGTIEEFVKYEPVEYAPFGRSPWPCLNPFCKQYMKESIKEVCFKKGSTGGRIAGTWECKECGFEYTRQGPDAKEEDKYRIGFVNKYGDVFDNKVKEVCEDTSLELEELVDLLQCKSVYILKKHMTRLGINPNVYNKRNAYHIEKVRIDKYKRKFIEKIQMNPDITLKEVRRTAGYKLLKEKDPHFCDKYFPKSQYITIGSNRFQARDQEIALQIECIAKDVIAKNKNVYMSKYFFQRQISYSGIKSNQILDKMPLTKQALENYCETKEEYNKRQMINKYTHIEKNLDKYKQKVEAYRKENPKATITEIRQLLGSRVVTLLNENYPEFCSQVFPKKKGVWVGTKEWEERDIKIAHKVEEIGREILDKNEYQRMTKRLFRMRTGYYEIENKKMLNDMPITKRTLEKYCETVEQYKMRKSTNGKID